VNDPTIDDSPEAYLDRLRDEVSLSESERELLLNRIVEKYPAKRLVEAARSRLGRLDGGDAEAILRLVEAFGDERLFVELAEAVQAQPDLPAERAWEALALLDARGMIEGYPALLERWEDLNETIEDDASLETLAAQLEEEPDGSWVALQGLSAVEPEVRAEIIAGLADLPGGPGLVSFLRLLAFAHDPTTRWAALDALDDRPDDDPGVRDAWRAIAETHPHPGVVERAREKLGDDVGTTNVPMRLDVPRVVRSLITAVDGEGRATIVLASREGERWAGAAFLCHVLRGVIDVVGQDGLGDSGLDEGFAALNEQTRSDVLEGMPELALRLLAGSLSLCGPETTPALRYWIERTAGPSFRADPKLRLFGDWDPSSLPFHEMPARARAVLAACPLWPDSSDLTTDLAREISLREGGGAPDPKRDSGAYRYLFEHRLAPRTELYQRMLFWMAAFWGGAGERELGQTSLALAWQLADAQHSVPSHPFFVEFTTMSLEAVSR
jgi:hypothetical protein